jgi:DASS family divalent anion:Na+ symporter
MESFALHSLSTPSSTSFLIHHHHRPRPIFRSQLSLPLNPSSRSNPSIKSSSISQSFSFPSKVSTFNHFSKPHFPIHANSTPPPSSESKPQQPNILQGAKPIPFVISIAIGLIVRFYVPKPIDVTPQAWQLLSIFLSTIAGLVLSPLPVGAWAFLGLTTSVVTKTLTFTDAFSAFTNEVIWLIVISFFFARGFVKTGLGDRIATYFVKWLGKSTLGLAYGLTFSEVLIAPAMPSTTARAGGVFLPIIKSLSLSAGSEPNGPTSKRLGAFLIQNQFQVWFYSILDSYSTTIIR